MLAYVLPFLAPPYILYITGTRFSIWFQWYHSLDTPKTSWEDIRVFLPSPAIKVAISDQLSLYYTQSLLRPTLSILLGSDFRCRSNGALHIAIKVLRGNVHRCLAVAVPLMSIICRSNTIIPLISYMTRARFSMAFQWCALVFIKSSVWEGISISSHHSTISPSWIRDKCCHS